MRRRFCPNRIFEGQTSQIRKTCLKFSSKRENSVLFMKIVQNALFRSCAARFSQIAFLGVKVLKIVTRAWNSLQKGKTVHYTWKLYKTLVSCHAQHVFAKSHFRASKFLKSSNWPEIVLKTGKLCAFHHNCTKRSFQVMRSTFWPNRILERQSCQNRYTGLKFSSKRENSARSIKILQNARFRARTARFGQIAFLRVKLLKIVTLVLNLLLNGKTVCFSWKFYQTFFSGHAQHTFWPNCIFKRQSSKNRHRGLKISPERENCALSIKIVQNARFRSRTARFGQIAYWSVKVVKIITLASNSLLNGKNSALSMKIVQNARFRSSAARIGQNAFSSVKVLKIVKLAWSCPQNGKTVRFPWKLYKTLVSGHAQHVLAKSVFRASKLSKSLHLS